MLFFKNNIESFKNKKKKKNKNKIVKNLFLHMLLNIITNLVQIRIRMYVNCVG